MKKKTKAPKKPKPRHRHSWSEFVDYGWDDGCYQSCHTCGAIRFKGDRYAYGSRWKGP